jgi:hypothetical protein
MSRDSMPAHSEPQAAGMVFPAAIDNNNIWVNVYGWNEHSRNKIAADKTRLYDPSFLICSLR